ncbi:DUF2544 domain-containing protein [Salmonella enterica subsp. salamae]|nr:DUF2544 domain-containing protein [Salmonella enterica subsp. salamae]ECJ2282080.1 DUF2544 domain-containing protein [Salmonella enterica subsp. salamae]
MRIIRTLFLFLAAVCCGSVVAKPMLSATFQSATLYYGIGPVGATPSIILDVTIATPEGVYYGVWETTVKKGQALPLKSWSGPEPAPTIILRNFDNSVTRSNCKNLPSNWYGCGSFTFDITVQSDDYGCPWLATSHVVSTPLAGFGGTYSPPDTRSSICPKVPVDTFDISWDPNTLKHDTVLQLKATGGTVTNTLHTYLMEGGKLCDGSKFDTRGAYCRFVATGIELNVLGCDQSAVKSTATVHPITDVEVHDINVSVNTKNIGTGQFSSTCNFQYILNEL